MKQKLIGSTFWGEEVQLQGIKKEGKQRETEKDNKQSRKAYNHINHYFTMSHKDTW